MIYNIENLFAKEDNDIFVQITISHLQFLFKL